jgi:hypothetical protein
MNLLKKIFLLGTPTQVNELDFSNSKLPFLLRKQLLENYPHTQFKVKGNKVTSDTDFSITVNAANRTKHTNAVVLQINFTTVQSVYLPNGVEECLAGIGEDDLSAVTNGLNSFMGGQLQVIMQSLSQQHRSM